MDKADCFALKTLAREQEFAKAIQIFFIRGEQRKLLSQRSLSPFRGFLSPDNGGTEGGVKTIEGGFAVSAPLREMLWNYEVGPGLTLMLF